MDSATVLAIAKASGSECYALSFDYGQLHGSELKAAKRVVQAIGVASHQTLHIDLGKLGGSALTDKNIAIPETETQGVPVTYVPARNTVFLSLALAWAEILNASEIYIGVNAVDYSGYPDCRPEFIEAFQKMAALATKAGTEGAEISIHTPLIHLKKAEIIKKGQVLGVDYGMTVTCYQADKKGRACGKCESCRLRKKGFQEAGVDDPTRYVC